MSSLQAILRSNSSRSRTNPREIYRKLDLQLSTIQTEIMLFNKRERLMSQQLLSAGQSQSASKIPTLKAMTMPKYQKILLEHQFNKDDVLPAMRRAVNKVSNVSKWQNGLKRMQSAKISSGTESIMLTSSNSKVFKQNNPEQSGVTITRKNSRRETMESPLQLAESLTQSKLMPSIVQEKKLPKPKTGDGLRRSKTITLKQQLQRKRDQLQRQWTKIDRYRATMNASVYLQAKEKSEQNKKKRQVDELIEKIKCSRQQGR